ncbi:MAG TPA: class I SAM-dependent methyltransferase [Lamprocystis sp. (in: g-proteobacteria)]|nr:class I SAM-dependent methyltransferase [Lamprocystis sp. (in: g-proteobacteria)]
MVVDHGTLAVGSGFYLCHAVRVVRAPTACYAVDTWEREEPARRSDTGFSGDECCYAEVSRLLRMPLREAVGFFSDETITLLHLDGISTDGLHDYEAVRDRFEWWLPKLSPSAVVLLHGTGGRDEGSGVRRFWKELVQRYPLNLEFFHSQGLGVLQLSGGDRTVALEWLSPDSAKRQDLLADFGARGVEIERQYANRKRQDAVSLTHSSLAERDKEVATLRYALAARDRELAEIGTLRYALSERDSRIAALSSKAAERDAMVASTSWRISWPLRALVRMLRGDSDFRVRLRRLGGRSASVPQESPTTKTSSPESDSESSSDRALDALATEGLPDLAPFVTYPDPGPVSVGRLTFLTDSLGPESLVGPAVTSILFAVALARHRGLRLRVVTRQSPPAPAMFGAVLAAHGVDYAENIEFEYAPTRADANGLAVATGDLILTTSWWTTWAARQSFDPSSIIFLVQDDGCKLIPAADQRARCRELFCDRRLRFVVSTSALRDVLVAQGMTGVIDKGVSFEPVVPATPDDRRQESRAGAPKSRDWEAVFAAVFQALPWQ